MGATTSRRRNNEKDAETRELLIDSAVDILRTSGFSAVSARKVAAKAGLSHQIVHYYFRSMEELLLDVIRRASVKHLDALEAAREAEQPLWTVWLLINKQDSGRLETEYLSIANRYSSAQQVLTKLRGEYTQKLVTLIEEAFQNHDIDASTLTPTIVSVGAHAIARTMALEAAHGSTHGHADIKTFIEHYIHRLEGPCRVAI